ncbi:hypothetical protein pb186bvf_005417 [Paramecium bursaria]
MNSFIVSQRGHIQYKSIIDAWTPEEDRVLCTNFQKYDGDFNKLLQLLPNRQIHEVRARWQKFEILLPINDRDDMKQNRGDWNVLDEIKFFEGLYLYGSDFESISKISLSKSQEDIHQRYVQYQYSTKVSTQRQLANKWNENDDILMLISHHICSANFDKIVSKFAEKNPKLVSDRFNQLNQRLLEKQAKEYTKSLEHLLSKIQQLHYDIEKIPLNNQVPSMTLDFNPKVRNRKIVSSYKLFQQIDENQWQMKEAQNSQEKQIVIQDQEYKQEEPQQQNNQQKKIQIIKNKNIDDPIQLEKK